MIIGIFLSFRALYASRRSNLNSNKRKQNIQKRSQNVHSDTIKDSNNTISSKLLGGKTQGVTEYHFQVVFHIKTIQRHKLADTTPYEAKIVSI